MLEKMKLKQSIKIQLNEEPNKRFFIFTNSAHLYMILLESDEGAVQPETTVTFESVEDAKVFLKDCNVKTAYLIQEQTYEEMIGTKQSSRLYDDAIKLPL